MSNEALLALAEAKQHNVDYQPLSDCLSFSIESKRCYIVLSTKLTAAQEKEVLAHELGHCEYGGFYNRYSKYDIRAKAERRADKWAFMKLLPVGEVKEACCQGINEIWEIAELFDVSCEYATKAIGYYQTLGLI